MGKLAGKKLLLLGERDGVPGPAMEALSLIHILTLPTNSRV